MNPQNPRSDTKLMQPRLRILIRNLDQLIIQINLKIFPRILDDIRIATKV